MPGKEPHPEDYPVKKPGGKPWPGYPNPMHPGKDWPKLAKKGASNEDQFRKDNTNVV